MRGDIRVVTRCAAVITAALQGSGVPAHDRAEGTASRAVRQARHG
jgi:hypothetical protein